MFLYIVIIFAKLLLNITMIVSEEAISKQRDNIQKRIQQLQQRLKYRQKSKEQLQSKQCQNNNLTHKNPTLNSMAKEQVSLQILPSKVNEINQKQNFTWRRNKKDNFCQNTQYKQNQHLQQKIDRQSKYENILKQHNGYNNTSNIKKKQQPQYKPMTFKQSEKDTHQDNQLVNMMKTILEGQKKLENELQYIKHQYSQSLPLRNNIKQISKQPQINNQLDFKGKYIPNILQNMEAIPLTKYNYQAKLNRNQNQTKNIKQVQKIQFEPYFKEQNNSQFLRSYDVKKQQQPFAKQQQLIYRPENNSIFSKNKQKQIFASEFRKEQKKNIYNKQRPITKQKSRQKVCQYSNETSDDLSILRPNAQLSFKDKVTPKNRCKSVKTNFNKVHKQQIQNYSNLIQLIKKQKNKNERYLITEDLKSMMLNKIDNRVRQTQKQYKQHKCNNFKHQNHHLVNTLELQKKLKVELMNKIYHQSNTCIYK